MIVVFFIIFSVVIALSLYLNRYYEIPVMTYHAIGSSSVNGSAEAVTLEAFRKQMAAIKKLGFRPISLYEYCLWLDNRHLSLHKPVLVTFDDGYKDNLAAVPILRALGFPAVMFVVPGWLGREGYMSAEDIKRISAGDRIDVNSHTLNHCNLGLVHRDQAAGEIQESRRILEDTLNQSVRAIAYPVGGFTREVLVMAKAAGYDCAFTTNRGLDRKFQRYAIRRIKITPRDNAFTLFFKLSGAYNLFRHPRKPF
jgi:peptidoglycan/xylan/chitin deacetylase (PgdA/CDA1 family)